MKNLLSIIILLFIVMGQSICQNRLYPSTSASMFKFLKLEYNNHFGTAYSLTIDSTGNITYRPSPEIKMNNKIVTRVTGVFSKEGFENFLIKLTDSLILKLAKRKNGCGIDEPTKDFKLIIDNKEILSEGCSLEPEVKLLFEYLDKLPASKDFVNRKKG